MSKKGRDNELNEYQKQVLDAYERAKNASAFEDVTVAPGEPQGLRDPNVIPSPYTAKAERLDPYEMSRKYANEFALKRNTIDAPDYLTEEQKKAYNIEKMKMDDSEGLLLFHVGGMPMIRNILLERMRKRMRGGFKKWILKLIGVLWNWRKK